MDLFEKIRVVEAADLLAISMTTADMIVVVDRDSTIVNGTCPMPSLPIDKQLFIVTTRVAITSLTMNANGKTVYGGSTTLGVGGSVGWIFCQQSNAWFGFSNFTSDIQAVLNDKQAPLVSGTNIKTINGASILGAGDLVVSAAGTPVYSRVTGSNVTTTGQVLVNITGLENALVANAVYEFEANLSVSTSGVTTGTAYGMNFSAAGATIEAIIIGASSASATKTLRINAFNAATSIYLATSGQTGGVLIKGIIRTGANPGNLTAMHTKLTSGTSTVFIDSFLKTIRIS